ncbi:hypothetical protein [Paractinoplanes ferrugineus]|uniref:hypothetical protein n=1 Tax=Paractinoplanes ferrugineus TaxID=113564 RepID=UPI001941EFD4|nr:hypothetical protein [Actinoplanes ferrugineus]
MPVPEFSVANPPFTPAVSTLPVSVPEADRVLLVGENAHVAAIAFRALPGAVVFQLLVKVRGADGQPPNPPPNIAFADLPELIEPGDLSVGARVTDRQGGTTNLPVYASGGGGDGSYEYIAWLALPAASTTLHLTASWPDQDLPQRDVRLDLDAIHDAARRATRIW